MNTKFLLLTFLSFGYLSANNEYISSEVTRLHHRIENIEKISLCNNILPYAMLIIGGGLVCMSDYKGQAFLYSFASYLGLTGLLSTYTIIQKIKARYYFRKFASKRISSTREVVEGHLTSFLPYVLNDDQFVILGLKCGFSELELIDLAKRLGRLEIAYKLKQFTL